MSNCVAVCKSPAITCGTWPLSVEHESAGAYGSAAWHASYAKYLEKWGE